MAAAKKTKAAEPPQEIVPAYVARLAVGSVGAGLGGLVQPTAEQKAVLAEIITPEVAATLLADDFSVTIFIEEVQNPASWIAIPAPETPDEQE